MPLLLWFTRFSDLLVNAKAATAASPNCATIPTTISCDTERCIPVTDAGAPILMILPRRGQSM